MFQVTLFIKKYNSFETIKFLSSICTVILADLVKFLPSVHSIDEARSGRFAKFW